MKDPAVLLYTGDFLNGCSSLTMEERGQYITLLCIQHQTGHLSEKTIRLNVGSVSVDVLSKFSIDEFGLYYHKRMDVEIEKRGKYIDSRKVNGSKGGRPKKPHGLARENHTENENENENSIVIEVEKEEKETRKKFITPHLDEVRSYCLERSNNVDPVKWFNFYSAKGWMIGKSKMKDWKASVRTWENNEQNGTKENFRTDTKQYSVASGVKVINASD